MRKFLYITFVIFVFGAFGQNPIVDYQFEASVKDSQANIDGILVNGGAYDDDRFGNPSSALFLDGVNQYVDMDNGGAAIISGNAITVEGWFNTNDFSN